MGVVGGGGVEPRALRVTGGGALRWGGAFGYSGQDEAPVAFEGAGPSAARFGVSGPRGLRA